MNMDFQHWKKAVYSTGIYESMNLTFNLEDDPEKCVGKISEEWQLRFILYRKRWYTVSRHIQPNVLKIEEHHKGMGIVRERDFDNIDGLVTNVPGICLVTSYATVFLFFLRTAAINVSDCPIRAGEERWEISHR